MKQNKSLFKTVLAAAFVSSMFGTVAVAHATEEVVIGAVLPLSGGAATIGNQTRVGLKVAVDQINQNGGIASMGGAKIRVVYADSQSKPDVGASETERLIERDGVALLVGAYNSAVTFPASEVAERYKTPWIVSGSVKNEITERGFKYVFRPNNKATYDAREQIDAIDLLKAQTGVGPTKIGLFYEGTDWGRSHAAAIKELMKERGYELAMDEAFPPNQMDFTSQMLKIRSSKPEALIVVAYTPDHILFNRQVLQNRLDIPFGIHSVGGGAEDPSFYSAVPQESIDYMFTQEDWQIDRLKADNDPLVTELNEAFNKELGYDFNSYGAQGASSAYIIKDVLERSGSADKEAIRSALVDTDITDGVALMVGYQRIKFDENGQNTYAHGVISQNLNGERLTIWPMENRLDNTQPVWPLPSWKDRK